MEGRFRTEPVTAAIATPAATAAGGDKHYGCAASRKGELPKMRGAVLTLVGVFARHVVGPTGRIVPAMGDEVPA
jgi:hypothetical protein